MSVIHPNYTLMVAMATILGTGTVSVPAGGGGTYTPPTPTHYVTSGAGGGGNGSEGSPWTLAEAIADTTDSKKVQIANGNYTIVGGGSSPGGVGMLLGADGAEDDELVFFAETTGSVNLTLTGTGAGIGNHSGAGQREYFRFHGLNIIIQNNGNYTAASECTPIMLYFCNNWAVTECVFDFNGFNAGGDNGVNWGAMFIQQADTFEIADCVFRNQHIPGSSNRATIETYAASNYEIHHNLFDTVPCPFFPKGERVNVTNVPGSFHHNKCVNVQRPFEIGYVNETHVSSAFLDIYQNSFHINASNPSKIFWRSYANTIPAYLRVVNNSFSGLLSDSEGAWYWGNSDGGPTAGGTEGLGCVLQNNIFTVASGSTWYYTYSTISLSQFAARLAIDYNCYQGVNNYFLSQDWGTWNSAGLDANGIEGNPLYVNTSTGDLRISDASESIGSGTSPCLNAGNDILGLAGGGTINMGAYILSDQSDVIGVRT